MSRLGTMRNGAKNEIIRATKSHMHANGRNIRVTASDDAMALPTPCALWTPCQLLACLLALLSLSLKKNSTIDPIYYHSHIYIVSPYEERTRLHAAIPCIITSTNSYLRGGKPMHVLVKHNTTGMGMMRLKARNKLVPIRGHH